MKSMRIIESIVAGLAASGFIWFITWGILETIDMDIHIAGKIIVCWLLAAIGAMMAGVIVMVPFLIARRISVIRRYKRIKNLTG